MLMSACQSDVQKIKQDIESQKKVLPQDIQNGLSIIDINLDEQLNLTYTIKMENQELFNLYSTNPDYAKLISKKNLVTFSESSDFKSLIATINQLNYDFVAKDDNVKITYTKDDLDFITTGTFTELENNIVRFFELIIKTNSEPCPEIKNQLRAFVEVFSDRIVEYYQIDDNDKDLISQEDVENFVNEQKSDANSLISLAKLCKREKFIIKLCNPEGVEIRMIESKF